MAAVDRHTWRSGGNARRPSAHRHPGARLGVGKRRTRPVRPRVSHLARDPRGPHGRLALTSREGAGQPRLGAADVGADLGSARVGHRLRPPAHRTGNSISADVRSRGRARHAARSRRAAAEPSWCAARGLARHRARGRVGAPARRPALPDRASRRRDPRGWPRRPRDRNDHADRFRNVPDRVSVSSADPRDDARRCAG